MALRHTLVTGANGFIGKSLCHRLVELGKEVTACVRDRADVSVFAEMPGSLNICRVPSLDAVGQLASVFSRVDAVLHLAGRAHIMHETADDPLEAYRAVNVGTTESLASIAAQTGVKRFIYVSSIKVNGESTNGTPFHSDDPPGYSDPYGKSKWEAEERLREIAEAAHMEWVIVRPPLVYGPGVQGNFLALLWSVFRRAPLPFGSVHNTRSLISDFNLSDFLTLLVDHPLAANNRFLVSDRNDISTPDLIRHVAVALHRPHRVVPCPEAVLRLAGTILKRRTAIDRLCSSLVVDRHKTKDLLGWNAPATLDWGLDRTASWFLKMVHK